MGNAVELSWATSSDGGSAITQHRYRYSSDGGNSWNSSGGGTNNGAPISDSEAGGANETTYTVTNLDIGQTYIFQVRAVSLDGSSSWTSSSGQVEIPFGYHLVKNVNQSTVGVISFSNSLRGAMKFTLSLIHISEPTRPY